MMLTPGGAVLVGAIAAVLSVCGFRFDHDHTDDEDNDDDHEDCDEDDHNRDENYTL